MLRTVFKSFFFALSVVFLFSCTSTGTFVDSRDGKIYKTVQIGEQTWMAENMNYKTKEGSHCFQCKKYGRLYEWEAAQKACPEGWHLPTKKEWKDFYSRLGHPEMLKANYDWANYNSNDIDYYSFSILPAGRYNDGKYTERGVYTQFWSADVNEGPYFVPGNNTNWSEINLDCGAAVSVRCVQGDIQYSKKDVQINPSGCTEAKLEAKVKLVKMEGVIEDPRDNKKYRTIKVRNREWLAEDLKYEMKGASILRTVNDLKTDNIYGRRDADSYLKLLDYLKKNVDNASYSEIKPILEKEINRASYEEKMQEFIFGEEFSIDLAKDLGHMMQGTINGRRNDELYRNLLYKFDGLKLIADDKSYSKKKGNRSNQEQEIKQLQKEIKQEAKRALLEGRLQGFPSEGFPVDLLMKLMHEMDDETYSRMLNFIVNDLGYGSCSEHNCGFFYEFESAEKACPDGWRLPTDDEWESLVKNIREDDSLSNHYSEKLIRSYFSIDENSKYWSSTPYSSDYDEFNVWPIPAKLRYSSNIHLKRNGNTSRVRCIRREETEKNIKEELVEKAGYFKNKKSKLFKYGTLKDARDGQTYKTVKIGNQNWMAENLRYAGKNQYVYKEPRYCYAHEDEYCDILGPMYFPQYDDGQNLVQAGYACPDGWHLPTVLEWETALSELKNKNMNIVEELSILLGGKMTFFSGSFGGLGEYATFLTEGLIDYAKTRLLNYGDIMIFKDSVAKIQVNAGEPISAYIRCVENPKTGIFKDTRDGITYKTVKIGNKTWMAENLKYKTNDSFCYADDDSNCKKMGRLYTHFAAEKACPAGWRLPTQDEFDNLPIIGSFNNDFEKGLARRTSYEIYLARDAWNTNAGRHFTSDALNFSLIPGGMRDLSGRYLNGPERIAFDKTYIFVYPHAYLWTSSINPENTHDDDYFFYANQEFEIRSGSEFLGLSVRCVKK
ncbi:MAG: hypothetical protein MJZ76_08605 [Bacteroidales bacterium]|nr:hypothetical protein [Bacteroidales bacterium]